MSSQIEPPPPRVADARQMDRPAHSRRERSSARTQASTTNPRSRQGPQLSPYLISYRQVGTLANPTIVLHHHTDPDLPSHCTHARRTDKAYCRIARHTCSRHKAPASIPGNNCTLPQSLAAIRPRLILLACSQRHPIINRISAHALAPKVVAHVGRWSPTASAPAWVTWKYTKPRWLDWRPGQKMGRQALKLGHLHPRRPMPGKWIARHTHAARAPALEHRPARPIPDPVKVRNYHHTSLACAINRC